MELGWRLPIERYGKWGNQGATDLALSGGDMTAELVYFGSRLVLTAASATAAAAYLRYAWLARRTWWLWPSVGGGFLCVTTGLSLYDGIYSFSLRPHTITVASWLWLLFVDLPMPILAILLGRVRRQRDHLVAELSRLSVSDQLTGLLNRRGFVERAVLAIAQSRRSDIALAVLMLDIDHFKAVNDGYGHAAGDTVLRSLATTMSNDRRSGDLVGRLGGEEFAVLLYATTAEEAFNVAERLRAEVKRRVPHPGGPDHQVTVSGGVAPVPRSHEPETALVQALAAADAVLYSAKRAGRDRVMTTTAPFETPA
jgi:diguanylate cyclase (GGDEF)-like protein